MEPWEDNWYTAKYGVDAFREMLEEFAEKEMWDVDVKGEKARIRVSQQEGSLHIDLYDRATGEGTNRIIPVGGFTLKQREEIARQALAAAEEGLPIMLKVIISPMIGGYWEDEEWDVITVHDIDRRKIDPNYRRFLR
ncbi:hypothetical protein [Planococcus salinus]|uniref:Uncharacterized protein n=1 Tax=Planococcus salinus TaxID=1848460 RepID=A0A3M8P8S0_9BACL|nr:hypothetical protein [Planococcus salinus]RNF39594.1 hypothetical protein EEX84_08970 [Planococcus salinus]